MLQSTQPVIVALDKYWSLSGVKKKKKHLHIIICFDYSCTWPMISFFNIYLA